LNGEKKKKTNRFLLPDEGEDKNSNK
jgi:hypothetical protein